VVLYLTLEFPLKEKSSQKIALNVALVVGVSVPSFSHWIFACKELENYRNKSLPFLDDLFLKFAMIIEQKSLNVSLDSEKDYDNNIYYFILSALLGGVGVQYI